ncbi:putative splicing factor u2af large subunit [Phaeomoniella chlamydospora]|uniref:Putative splicing factor u2af large subunit n=1 Tax=Phaeomoniella chlamydospora TaxID=158046 RepID=A0A0G2GYI2_PHACM|nr:putative splicing factor u2af large subunit [Phaeomoniella chlamydospora]
MAQDDQVEITKTTLILQAEITEQGKEKTDVVSVLDRKRRLTQWDIKPPGYENVTAEQAKLSGMFPLPGAPRQQPMDPSKLQAFMNQPSAAVSTSALKPSMARQSKRLFVYNIPHSVNEESLVAFFNLQMNGLNAVDTVDPCISASMSTDGTYALVEFKNPSDATLAQAFDGMDMPEHAENGTNGNANGSGAPKGLNIRRPKDYIVPSAEESDYSGDGISTTVPDTANKISISNIPPYLNEEQITELLVSFGELKAFTLVKDSSTEESRGIAFCEYADPAATTIAVEGLNEMELGDRKLKVQLASIGFQQAAGLEMGVNAMSMFAGMTSTGLEEGQVLQLLNMVIAEELIDNDEYEGEFTLLVTRNFLSFLFQYPTNRSAEIKEDILEECQNYGRVLEIKIPRPSGGSRQSAGVGKIYVKFDSNDSAKKALQALAGRKFADRTVVTTYFSEESFDVNAW